MHVIGHVLCYIQDIFVVLCKSDYCTKHKLDLSQTNTNTFLECVHFRIISFF